MSIERMSFNETPDYLNAIGFQVHISFSHRSEPIGNYIIINKGSLIFGFKNDYSDIPYGFLFNNDVELLIGSDSGTYYILCDKEGLLQINKGNFNNLRGLGANISGVPWYTFNDRALIGKVFQPLGLISGYIVCDDVYWCEYEE